jgi:hypothetical protein
MNENENKKWKISVEMMMMMIMMMIKEVLKWKNVIKANHHYHNSAQFDYDWYTQYLREWIVQVDQIDIR